MSAEIVPLPVQRPRCDLCVHSTEGETFCLLLGELIFDEREAEDCEAYERDGGRR